MVYFLLVFGAGLAPGIVRVLWHSSQAQRRIAAGLLAMEFVLAADVVGITLRGLSVSDVFVHRDPVSGTAYYLHFAGIRWLITRFGGNTTG